MTRKAASLLRDLYHVFMEDVRLLPGEAQRRVREAEAAGGISGRARGVADYIAGMTDRYAIAEHQRVFAAGAST